MLFIAYYCGDSRIIYESNSITDFQASAEKCKSIALLSYLLSVVNNLFPIRPIINLRLVKNSLNIFQNAGGILGFDVKKFPAVTDS